MRLSAYASMFWSSRARAARARHRASSDELRPKIDLSKIAKPGDALKAIIEQKTIRPLPCAPQPPAARPPEAGKPRQLRRARLSPRRLLRPRLRRSAAVASTACRTCGGAAVLQTAFHYSGVGRDMRPVFTRHPQKSSRRRLLPLQSAPLNNPGRKKSIPPLLNSKPPRHLPRRPCRLLLLRLKLSLSRRRP